MSGVKDMYMGTAGERDTHTPTQYMDIIDLPLSTYILVEQPPPPYAQRLDWVSGHHMTREQHASLSPAPQITQAVAPVASEYLPAQKRDE